MWSIRITLTYWQRWSSNVNVFQQWMVVIVLAVQKTLLTVVHPHPLPRPVSMITFPSDSSIWKGIKEQESAVVTSADFQERLRERRQKNGRQNRPVLKSRTYGCHSERRIGMDGAICSASVNSDENYCGVCNVIITTRKLVNSGLSVLETVDDVSTKFAWKMGQIWVSSVIFCL